MSDPREPSEVPDDQPQPERPIKPKRGAFPTPKSELDKAEPYVPDSGDGDDADANGDHSTKK